MIIKRLFLTISLLVLAASLFGQVEEAVTPTNGEQKERTRFSEKLVFDADIGLSFGTFTYIKVAPDIGYRLTPRLTAGLGPIYIYERYKDYSLETSTYGGKISISYTVLRGKEDGGSFGFGDLVLHAENEVVSVESIQPVSYGIYNYYTFGNRVWIDNLLLGPGLIQSISNRFKVAIYLLWDVTQNPHSYYSNPVFKFGVIYSLGN